MRTIAAAMRHHSRILILAAGLAGIGWMVYVSLYPGEYYLLRVRSGWTHPTLAVVIVAVAMAAETGAAYWVLRSPDRLWRRGLTALVGFLPLWVVGGAAAHRSAPPFYLIHALWVSALIAFFVIVSLTHGSLCLFRRLGRRQGSSREAAVEQSDAPDNKQDS